MKIEKHVVNFGIRAEYPLDILNMRPFYQTKAYYWDNNQFNLNTDKCTVTGPFCKTKDFDEEKIKEEAQKLEINQLAIAYRPDNSEFSCVGFVQ